MADVDPFVVQIPEKFLADPELRPFFTYLNRFLHDLWIRTGGGDDFIQEVQIGELYETGIESARTVELEEELNDFDFQPILESEDNEDSWQPQVEKVWHKEIITTDTDAADYAIYMIGDGSKLTLPEYPNVDSEVIAINRDNRKIRVDGNGNDIKVKSSTVSCVDWSTAGKSIHFHWFEQGPYWVAI